MEVDSVLVNGFEEQAFSPYCYDVYDDFGDPNIFPKVGEQYQAEIPPLMSESDCSWFQKKPQPEDIDITLVNGTKLGASGNSSVQQETKIGVHENKCKGHCLVPGSSTDTWNEIEEASFTLGLYIFGKNLVKVKRFIGNKTMGDIMAFYYGKFYKSERYQRWSELRKMKSRKCIHGQKIFTGPRQQELLSRLLPNVPEECHSKFLEASVGLNPLVEAVGVGTKKDLTGLTADSVKSTQALHVRLEKPVGKDCSRLTPVEIINILTGNFRLSKARSGDLFWEAVWPHLLARGWHSEKLGSDDNYVVAYKHPLIFLVPRVTNDDCITKEGNGCTKETKLDQENSPDSQHHCYPMPPTPICSTEVNNTTLSRTEITEKDSTSEDDCNNEDASEEQTKGSDFLDSVCLDKGKTDASDASKFIIIAKKVPSRINGIENKHLEEVVPIRSIGSTNPSVVSKDQKTDLLSNTQEIDAMECQSIKRKVPDSNNIEDPPVTKNGD
ncbi:uncharacterized protein LOC133304922 [Gastrolobium bilobum]|uniref:uncharacterized protein LOC133304922 n=1 Tax=Gastrolobium bilobum TaxID=150636 RepID=UPI002AB0F2E0|nr:uncharacterized protein LOC133304922 [Gastrolobium bilobum]